MFFQLQRSAQHLNCVCFLVLKDKPAKFLYPGLKPVALLTSDGPPLPGEQGCAPLPEFGEGCFT